MIKRGHSDIYAEGTSHPLHVLVRELLSDKSREDIPVIEFADLQQRSVQILKNLLHATKEDMQLLRIKYQEEVSTSVPWLMQLPDTKRCLRRIDNYTIKCKTSKGNIRVYCRVRPFLPGQANGSSAVEDVTDNIITIITPSKVGKEKKSFTFNKCFGPCSSQEEVFADTQPLIRSVLDGYNVTYLLMVNLDRGKLPQWTKGTYGKNLRSELQDDGNLQQQVRDLLVVDGVNRSRNTLEIRNNTSTSINVPNANLLPVTSTEDVISLMNLGHKNRAVGSILMNDRSSRSHSCLMVHVQGRDLTSGSLLRGCMHLVDLAGSERLNKTEAVGDRLKEAQHINRSLSALGDVISSLAQKQSHVPYRNNKLTQLLQDSLGGKAKTLMFVHISPEPVAALLLYYCGF
ncbi:hypothetical protein OROMI_003741 [Orobanche minor]